MIGVSKKRLKFLDIAKGLGMMMIVWMHIWGNNSFEFTPPSLLNRFIVGIYVPLFFVLSGYLIKIENMDIKMALIKQTKSILRPFLVVYIFSFFISFLLSVIGIGVKHEFEWSNFLNPLYSKTFFNGPLWFLLALFWAFAIFYTISKISREKIVVISLLTLFVGYIGFYLSKKEIILPLFVGQGMVACPMLMMGYLLKKYFMPFSCNRKIIVLFGMLIGATIYLFVGTGLSMQSNRYDGYYLQLLLGVFGGAIFFLCISMLLERYLPFIEYWGKYSLVILCFHNFILIPCAKITGRVLHQPVVWSLGTFIIIYLCFLLIIPLVSKFLPSLFNIRNEYKKI